MADQPIATTLPSSEFVWNKWDTENFIVLSIDKSQGLSIKNKIEAIKSSFEKKCGKKFDFSIPCKVICTPDGKLLSRFFNIDASRAEARRDSDGKIVVSAIWTEFEDIDSLSSLVATICLENSNNSLCIKRGLVELEKNVNYTKSNFEEYSKIDAKKIFLTNSPQPEESQIFNKSSALICLLLRKEFGSTKFDSFMSSSQDEVALKTIYGFSFESFSETANRYFENLSKDIKNNKVPDKYLQFNR
jgi:hypothetical protein